MATQAIVDLKERLHNGEVTFEYKKKDGTIRRARGTLRMDVIPEQYWPVLRPTAPDNVRYWDLDSEGWRSFIPDNFVRIVGMVQEYQRDGTYEVQTIRKAQECQSPYL